MKGIAQIIVCASFGNRFCKYMPGHQTNKPESLQNNASSINQYWKATFMWWTLEEPDQWTGNGCFIFPLRLPVTHAHLAFCTKCHIHLAWLIKRLFCRLLLQWAGYLSISSLKTNSAAPKYFWSSTFRESVRNQLPTCESKRLWDSQQSRETWHVDLF